MAGRKKLSKRLLQSRAAHVALSVIGSIVLRAIYLTTPVEKRHPEATLPYLSGEKPAIFCFWHGRMIMLPFGRPPGRSMWVLSSHHNDGSLIVEMMRRFNIGSVRSSKRIGTTKGLLNLLRITQAGGNISFTPDGPRGPFQKAAEGAAYVAAKTGYPLIPVTFSATRHWRFRSWDKFMLPKPFSRVVFITGAPITVENEDIKTATEILETTLTALTTQADLAMGIAPVIAFDHVKKRRERDAA